MCCVKYARKRGKGQPFAEAYCKPLRKLGQKCMVHANTYRPPRVAFDTLGSCPCGVGLHCSPFGGKEYPKHRLGSCVPGGESYNRIHPHQPELPRPPMI